VYINPLNYPEVPPLPGERDRVREENVFHPHPHPPPSRGRIK